MADVSKITVNSTTYNLKDSLARDHISNHSNPHNVTKAQIGLGNVSNYDQSKAIKSITRSGTTFTTTALDGTTSTFTQQDTDTTYSVFTGATASSQGSTGLVPKPTIEDVNKYLCGDGTWKAVSGGTSDAPVQVSGSVYDNNIKSGTITAYRIGHLLHIYAEGLSVTFKVPGLKIFVINIIDGFHIETSSTPWVSFDIGDGEPDSFGVASIDTSGAIYLMGRGNTAFTGIFFSLIVPLIDA